ncbi:hypothetical protein EZV62_015545 [Acer yangbiense]|uniref:PH domain-containing protein n=1 Tax=Acer yangbiense TaxID=1000413 RepID=A0A5C7HN35_9ROSI|nr:hypothetical protein EZV62_015545 [Acer yangbiense]
MFEGLVRQLILGYLGRYVKDIQKEQLKITLWNGEVLLENVDLILEAFDYLQLPFALKQGRVGRLSIRIPWKNLGLNPIVIILEDVFVSASQRDDQEWSLDAVERREFAGKKAKLAAAELAKLSRRVCDYQAGQSFTSFLTAKVLDGIQVSIRNFHVLYSNTQLDSAQIMFSLKFSSLTIMKQNLVGSYSGKARGGQVNKIVEIKDLEICCSTFQSDVNLLSLDNVDSKFWSNKFDHILKPFNVSVSLMINRSGKLDDDLPQYSINTELTRLVLSLDEVQLQEIFILLDYLSTSRLREKYGRYRPRYSPLSKKPDGWQKLWWQYAQQSVLSDVRKELKKTSWRYLGQRLSYRRKYVSLYKTKLDCLQQEQSIDESVVRELEQMEKESDIDDILSYRSTAECELQEAQLNSLDSHTGVNGDTHSIEKSRNDERGSGRSRGWLNWLSRGMLGAGGTDDSSQFSGVVSDEVVKDIYEATKFHPLLLSGVDSEANDKSHTCAIKFNIGQISAALRSRSSCKKIAKLILEGAVIDCNIWEELANISAFIKSVKMVSPCNKKVILLTGGSCTEENALQSEKSSLRVEVDRTANQDVELSVKVMLQPLEATFDREFFLNIMEFFTVLKSFESQHERVLSSLNGIKDMKARLISKAGYILSSRRKVIWDVSITNFTINVPWRNIIAEEFNLVFELETLIIKSKCDLDSLNSNIEEQSHLLDSTCNWDISMGFQLQDLYNHFEVKLNDCEIKLVMPHYLQTVHMLEKFQASITFASCVISDESKLNQFEVYVAISPLQAHFSPSIYGSIVALIAHLDSQQSRTVPAMLNNSSSLNVTSNRVENPVFGLSISANLESVSVHVDLENDGENSSLLMLTLQDLDISYSLQELEDCWICLKALKISFYPLRDKEDNHILALCGDAFASSSAHQQDMQPSTDESSSTETCFFLHYESPRTIDYICKKCTVCLIDTDLHCYPYIFAPLIGFFDKISSYGSSGAGQSSSTTGDDKKLKTMPDFGFQRFGFSNFFETSSADHATISLDSYPFITISNTGFLCSLEKSLLHSIPDWRKVFNVRERKLRSSQCSLKRGSKTLPALSLESTSDVVEFPVSGSSDDTNQFFIDISLSEIRVHFHDSSCIVGTLTLPSSKSSVSINENSMDLLFSLEGLVLTSSWWTKTFHKFLWGPSLPNLSPILNLRVRKANVGSLSSQLEVSLGIQHVCCVLPPEYLAIIIGYFSLPDWGSNSSEQTDESAVVYKFEVLDSTLIVPVENDLHQLLKVEMQQFYCSYIPNCASNNILVNIPPEYMVPAHKVAKENNCLNLFGQGLILSFLLFKDDGCDCLMFDQDTGCGNVILIAPFSADVWVRIPSGSKSTCESSTASTCIMSSIHNCQLMADDCYSFDGFEALLEVIDRFSSVGDESKLFTTDVPHYLQLKKCLRESSTVTPVASGMIFTEVRCCFDSLLVKLHHFIKDPVLLKPVAEVEMQFVFSASLVNETLISLDANFSSLALHSLLNTVILAKCTINHSTPSVLGVGFSKSDHGKYEFHISLPSFDVWLHLYDWTEIIDLCHIYSQKMAKTARVDVSLMNSAIGMVDMIETLEITPSQSSLQNSSMSTHHVSQNMKQDTAILILRSENIGLTVHFPIWVNEEAIREYGVAEIDEGPQNVSSSHVVGKHSKYISITTHSKSSEIIIADKNVKLKVILDKTSGSVGTSEENSVNSWPFFQIFQVDVETEISRDQMELVHTNVNILCHRIDVWLSHRVLYFWRGVVFDIPEAGSSSSQLAIPSMNFKIQLRKMSLLISDGRWSCSGHLLEILICNFMLHTSVTESSMDGSVTSELKVNYNNIRKVSWEPFIEPWKFQINMTRKHEMTTLLNSSFITDIDLTATAQLNLNLTESLVECILRTIEMIKDAWGLVGPDDCPGNQISVNPQLTENIRGGRYAPYVLQNLTALPLTFSVCQGILNSNEFDVSGTKDGKPMQPGASIPIYLNETPYEQLFRYRSAYSSDRLSEKQSNAVAHHFMTVQLDGTSVPSIPISMDLVGLTYFEVDFSNASKKIESEETGEASKYNMNIEENVNDNTNNGFLVPVVFDVSVQGYSKLIRLYSTVILSNATSVPLELRFDIPFSVSPKILDPIYPGQEFPLPLHLAEAGRMRWRPLGKSYLWSEAHNISNILLQESKLGYLRSFVCYPSHPSSDPFRCCISVQNIMLPSSISSRKVSSCRANNSKNRFIHLVTLSTPFVVNNYLPETVTLTIETGGITRTALLSEVQTSFHDIDPSHDLGLELNIHGFRPSVLKFPRAETFSTVAKLSATNFSLSENVTLDPVLSSDSTYVIVEKTMNAFSGAREVFISVPFLLYNCTGFPLIVSHSTGENKGSGCTVACSYDLGEQELQEGKKDGLSLLSLDQDTHVGAPETDGRGNSLLKNHIVSTRKNVNPDLREFLNKPLISHRFAELFPEQSNRHDFGGQKASVYSVDNRLCLSRRSSLKETDFINNGPGKVQACMYSPLPVSTASEILVRVSWCLTGCVTQNVPNSSWSGPFPLVPPSGSTSVTVPQPSSNAAFIISVTASGLTGPFAGRTRAITFQPRYVISNACSKDLCYKQKGTDFVFNLGIGQHSHLHLTDTARELLVSIRFNEPGWQWSGSFLPDHLGDTQLKMRNYVSGALKTIRVEVQNADVSIRDEKIVGSLHGNSGTNLILLSDDDTGYMPYRIDNFSMERLRIYQQRCETFDTIIHPYTSCPYAWDEPCYPHRLIVEVPGERVLGSYILDDLKDYIPVHLHSTAEKPERTLLLSNHAEGATKVFSIIDSSYHILKDMKNPTDLRSLGKTEHEQKQDNFVTYRERFSFNIPYIGLSIINLYPQELLFACAKNITIDLLQSLDRQQLSFQVTSLQLDNQLPSTPYPVILSFNQAGHRTKDDGVKLRSERGLQITSDSSFDPVFYLSVAKWRKKDISLVSFEHISLRISDFRLELEQEVILGMLEFLKTVSQRFQSAVVPFSVPALHPITNDLGSVKESSVHCHNFENVKTRHDQSQGMDDPAFSRSQRNSSLLPSIVPIGAPWQQIYLLARRQKKIYVELFDLSPIKFSLSFSSAPWTLRNAVPTSGESLIHRGLMALADVEGAQIHLRQLTIAHHMASWESIQEILMRHYTRQFLHEMYKVFGSAGVIGNPMGFARSLGLGIRDFLSVPARSVLQSPTGLISGMAQGTTSLVSNTVYALSDAATQFSKAAHKGIVAFTFDDQAVARMEKQQKGVASHSKGVINEVLEGLTGLLQSPIKEAEKHGLPGLLSGIAFGVTGLVARPAASILEVTGKTAQSIRNRSKLYHIRSKRYRVRLPRPLSRELPLRPYSWEEAIGVSVLMEADDGLKFKDEVLVMSKSLKQAGKFVIVTQRLILIVSCSSLVDLGKPEFEGVAVDPEWVIESEISLDSVIHADTNEALVHIVGSRSGGLSRKNQHLSKRSSGTSTKWWNDPSTPLPLFQTNLELTSQEDAGELLQILLSTIEEGKGRSWGSGYILHQSNIK